MDGAVQELLDAKVISGEEAYHQAFEKSKFAQFKEVS